MAGTKFNFDEQAASWDKNPGRVRLANDIADAVSHEEILAPAMDVLEFGCGTGLLTLRLHPLVHSVTAVDSSPGMLGVLATKIENQGLSNIRLQLLDSEKTNLPDGCYHLVLCSMTLHHIRQIEPLLLEFYRVTNPDGYLCIADLDLDDGQFHGENDTVFHNGFNRATLRSLLERTGFADIRDRMAATVKKPAGDGRLRSFGVFLITARKRALSLP